MSGLTTCFGCTRGPESAVMDTSHIGMSGRARCKHARCEAGGSRPRVVVRLLGRRSAACRRWNLPALVRAASVSRARRGGGWSSPVAGLQARRQPGAPAPVTSARTAVAAPVAACGGMLVHPGTAVDRRAHHASSPVDRCLAGHGDQRRHRGEGCASPTSAEPRAAGGPGPGSGHPHNHQDKDRPAGADQRNHLRR